MKPSGQVMYRTITTPQALQAMIADLAHAPRVGVDLEADSMFHYREKVCLLQLATHDMCYVVDPLALQSLEPLRDLFAHRDIQKIFHGADYDIRSLHRDFNITVNNLFDTQLASRFLGLRATSLEAVVAARCGIKLDKRYQRRDWSKRPLPRQMVEYAARDSLYLVALATQLETELDENRRLAWVQEECRALSRVRTTSPDSLPLFLNFKGAGRLGPRSLAVLEALLQYRDKIACRKDRPHFKIIGNQALMQLATSKPSTPYQLEKTGVLSPKQLDWYGNALITIIKEVLQSPAAEFPVYPRKKAPPLPPQVPERIRALRTWRDHKASELKIDPTLLLTKAQLAALAIAKPVDQKQLVLVDGLKTWRRQVLGPDIVRILRRSL